MGPLLTRITSKEIPHFLYEITSFCDPPFHLSPEVLTDEYMCLRSLPLVYLHEQYLQCLEQYLELIMCLLNNLLNKCLVSITIFVALI